MTTCELIRIKNYGSDINEKSVLELQARLRNARSFDIQVPKRESSGKLNPSQVNIYSGENLLNIGYSAQLVKQVE